MKNVKLKGLKSIRIDKRLTPESLAFHMNLLNAKELKTIITPEYIKDLEINDQVLIEDDVINALVLILETDIDTLLGNKPYNNVNKGTKQIRVKQYIPTLQKIKYKTYEVPIYFSAEFIKCATEMLSAEYKNCETLDDWNCFTNDLQRLFDLIKDDDIEYKEDSLSDPLYYKWFITRFIYQQRYSYYIEITKLAEIMCHSLLSSGMPIDYIIELVVELIRIFLDFNLL